MTVGRWVVFDTNVYVSALREGLAGPSFARLEEAAPRTFLAVAVSAELHAGALDDAGRKVVVDLAARFHRLARGVVPTERTWHDAGQLLATIARREPAERTRVRHLWNDALIVLSARQIGATVVTGNVGDFRLLARYARFALEAAPGAAREST